MHCTKISAEFEICGHSPHCVCTPKNVALGYDVGKISARCLVCFKVLFRPKKNIAITLCAIFCTDCPSSVTVTPSSGPFNEGDVLTCTSDGHPQPSFQWTDSDGIIVSSTNTMTLTGGSFNLTCTATGNVSATCNASKTVSVIVNRCPTRAGLIQELYTAGTRHSNAVQCCASYLISKVSYIFIIIIIIILLSKARKTETLNWTYKAQ